MNIRALVVALTTVAVWTGGPAAQTPPATGQITIAIDAGDRIAPMKPVWAWSAGIGDLGIRARARGELTVSFQLPRQAVWLLRFAY
jgi:hypothetical protein